ncbi:Amiloride-sensitive sodium channel [Ancylostoma ceylanicum]|uniref:Amiloride-sensitive sodium channel n=1 Tax=Ancylostoma ceylanicum TaxID=53326 RepID=A0A0D6M6R2_9BILA|nr:Amiloride-sensitive sodium channel [Ancylostoma ceylanicum]
MYHVLYDYFTNGTTTRLTVKQNATLLFPSIHICPKNPDHLNYDVLFRDITRRLGNLSMEVKADILLYFIAGTGFQNTNVEEWSAVYRDSVRKLVTRCFRLDNYYQKGGGSSHSLRLNFKHTKGLINGGAAQKQVVVHFGDEYPDISKYPRIYITDNDYGTVKFKLRKVSMMRMRENCTTDPLSRGRYTCYLSRWLQEKIIEPFNCTLPHLRNVTISRGYNICSPHVIVSHYGDIMSSATLKNKCILNCERWDLFFDLYTNWHRKDNAFRLDLSYRDLSYEEYVEIEMLSLPSFISQIGGQLGLFLGTSIISLIHLTCYLLTKITEVRLRVKILVKDRSIDF